jgi:hypothetical protein
MVAVLKTITLILFDSVLSKVPNYIFGKKLSLLIDSKVLLLL